MSAPTVYSFVDMYVLVTEESQYLRPTPAPIKNSFYWGFENFFIFPDSQCSLEIL